MVINHPHTITVTQATLYQNSLPESSSSPPPPSTTLSSPGNRYQPAMELLSTALTPALVWQLQEDTLAPRKYVTLEAWMSSYQKPNFNFIKILLQCHNVCHFPDFWFKRCSISSLAFTKDPCLPMGWASFHFWSCLRWFVTFFAFFNRRWGTSRTQHFHWLGAVDQGGLNFFSSPTQRISHHCLNVFLVNTSSIQ